MNRIEIYTKNWCRWCERAKALLDARNLPFVEFDVTDGGMLEEEMIERSGKLTVPQVFLDGESIGGYDNLVRLDATGDLQRRFQNVGAQLERPNGVMESTSDPS